MLIPSIKECGSLSFGWTVAGSHISSQLQPSQQMGQVISLSQHSPKSQAEAPHGLCLANSQLIRPQLPI